MRPTLTTPPAIVALLPAEQPSTQERARRQDHGRRRDACPVGERDTGDAIPVEDKPGHLAFAHDQRGCRRQTPLDRRPV